ncbi:MAG: helix-turn-helix transcriptional regulator [Desulfobacula sp.]|uniref:helix-turn-helix domain-containing protein n=1 Tax=Desulfobacula sp. TaxID=2593537 RepID=UPI0025C125DE|nr:helix-turn-helix transcriptional regulator [Desulfobacula sp.]MCD4718534.1 helix-turn-helix transcriptional regulator [Desulfobacula sp.]
MLEQFGREIKKERERFKLSLAQFGSLVGAPAVSVKRWEQGVKPQERFVFQIVLVLGLINDPDEIFFDLGRQGIVLDEKHWEGFASLVKAAKKSLAAAKETGLPEPDVAGALVAGIFGLLSLIATAFATKNMLGAKACSSFATRIAQFLK